MSEQFLETEDGLINLRFVRRIRVGRKGQPDIAYLDDGDEFRFDATPQTFENLQCQIVPAAAGEYAIAVWIDEEGEDGKELTVSNVWTREIGIVAWRIYPASSCDPTPVFKEDPCGDAVVLLREADGTLIWPGLVAFPDIETAKADLLQGKIDTLRRKAAAQAASLANISKRDGGE
jgi:hypothetical protein